MVINQFHANGDIIFIEPICRHFWNKNSEKPILPVRDHLMWFANYIESACFVPMSKFSLDYDSMEVSNPDYLPLRFANQIVRGLAADDHSDFSNTMPDKYKLAGIDLHKWKTLQWTVNNKKCAELLSALDISLLDKFIFVNENSQAGKIEINPENPNGYRIIKMRDIPGFTLLDWYQVMLLAEEHHHISTSTFFMLEFMKEIHDKNVPIYMYPRPNIDGLQGISKLNPSFEYISIE